MKIGIDARLYGEAGIGRYIRNLLLELEKEDNENEYIIFVNKSVSDLYHPANPKFKKWVTDCPPYSIREQIMFLIDLLRARVDLVHIPHFNVPILYYRKYIVTIHDLTMHEFTAADSSTLSDFMHIIKQVGYYIVFFVIKFRALKIIVPSKVVKDELVQKTKFESDKIVITPEGVENNLLKLAPNDIKSITPRLEQMRIKNKYFLYVGSAYPHKNIKNLFIAYDNMIKKLSYSIQLVIAGKVDTFSQKMAAFSHGLKLDNLVIYAAKYSEGDIIPEKDLAYLYKGAFAYISPSLKEGFSITPLEAQAFGIPVIASDIPTHREVLGESALYFDPKSTIDMANKLLLFLGDEKLREDLIQKGLQNVTRYSWNRMALQTLDIYNTTLVSERDNEKIDG